MTEPGKFLIVTWDGGGNTPPMVNLGARLVGQGHRVRLLGWETMRARASIAGLEFGTYPSVPPWPAHLAFEDAWEDRVEPALHSAATRDDILAHATDFGPDVVVVDCMMNAAYEAAILLGMPSAVLVHLIYSRFADAWGDDAERAKRGAFLREMDAVLALVPPGFDEPCAMPVNTAYVGPINDPNPCGRLDTADVTLLTEPGDPWVLLSLGTTQQRQLAALPIILDAVAALPVRVLLTLGGVLQPTSVAAPSNVAVRGFIAHDLLLPHMSAVISHAGLSTINAALTAGVPLLCIPQGRDQYDNAERVARSGVGRALGTEASATEIAVELTDVLGDQGAQRQAGRFAEVIAELGGGQCATRMVTDLLGDTKRA